MMQATRKKIRQNRLQKYGRILSRRYSLNVYLQNLGGNIGYTDSTNKVFISANVDTTNDFKNLVLQKGVVLHEIGHILYTNNSLWLQQSIDKSIINIVEDGRVEERISREYAKARLYFIYLNQDILKIKKQQWEDMYTKSVEAIVMDAMLREAKKTTGVPQLPKKYAKIIEDKIGSNNYTYLIKSVREAVDTENEDELYRIVNDIDSKMNKLFPKSSSWDSRDNVAKTHKKSLTNSGKTSLKEKSQTQADKDLVKKLQEELQKQAEKMVEEQDKSTETEDTDEGKIKTKGETEKTEEDTDSVSEGLSTAGEKVESEDGEEQEETDSISSDSSAGELENLDGGEKQHQSNEEDQKGNDEDFEELEESGILDSINNKLESESFNDIQQESSLIQSKDVEADFSDYGDLTSLNNIWTAGDPIATKNLDPVANKISHLFKAIASTGDGWTHNQTRGRLEMHKITSLMSGNSRPRVFKRNDKVKEVDLSACILIDGSSSMKYDYRYVKAVRAGYTVTKALELGGYKSEVVNFFGSKQLHGVKSFNQKIEYALKEFAPFYSGGTPLKLALDGAEKSLARQASKRKIIIVATDGAPNNAGDCRQKIKQLEAKGIIVIGILINTYDYNNVFNSRHRIVCQDINKLPLQMTEVIKKVLLSIRRT